MSELTEEQIADGLKPCPFCGEKAEMTSHIPGGSTLTPDGFSVWCSVERCQGHGLNHVYFWGRTKEAAINKWNARSPDKPDPAPKTVAYRIRPRYSAVEWSYFTSEPISDPGKWDFEDYDCEPLYTHPSPASSLIRELMEALDGVYKFSLVIDSAVRNYDPRSIASGQYAEVAAVLKQVRDLRRAAEAVGGGE